MSKCREAAALKHCTAIMEILKEITITFERVWTNNSYNNTIITIIALLIWTSVITEAIYNLSHRYRQNALLSITIKTMMIPPLYLRKRKTILMLDCISSTKSRLTTIVRQLTQGRLRQEEELQEGEISTLKGTDINQMCFRSQERWWYDSS